MNLSCFHSTEVSSAKTTLAFHKVPSKLPPWILVTFYCAELERDKCVIISFLASNSVVTRVFPQYWERRLQPFLENYCDRIKDNKEIVQKRSNQVWAWFNQARIQNSVVSDLSSRRQRLTMISREETREQVYPRLLTQPGSLALFHP